MDDEKEIERKAQENLKQWNEYLSKIDKASEQAGITLEQGMNFLERLYENEHK